MTPASVSARRGRDPAPVVQPRGRPARRCPRRRCTPAPAQPVGPDDLLADLPDGPDLQEVAPERWIADPRPGARDLLDVAAHPAVPRARPGDRRSGHPQPHLLQVRGRQPAGQPQAQHVGAAGVLQPPGGHQPPRHRDRRRPVGVGPGLRLPALRHGVQGLHGAGLLRPEALPPLDDAHLGRRGRGQPLARHQRRPGDPRGRPRQHRQPRHRHQRGGRGRRHARRHQVHAWAACSTTCCCTRRSSAWRRKKQLAMAGADPDVVIGCVGGGTNFAGLAFPFLADKAAGKDIRIVAAEPAACPTLTRGHYRYDFGDTTKMTPLLKMYTLGHGFVPPADPRRRAALPRHGPAGLARGPHRAGRGARLPPERVLRRGGPFRPLPRGSSRRPSPRTRCAPWSRRPRGPARRAWSARSSSTSAATATSTWPPTTRTSRASWSTPSSPQAELDVAAAELEGLPAL